MQKSVFSFSIKVFNTTALPFAPNPPNYIYKSLFDLGMKYVWCCWCRRLMWMEAVLIFFCLRKSLILWEGTGFWHKFSEGWNLVTFVFICLLLQYKSKVSTLRSLQFDQGCALEAWTPLGLKIWRRKRNGRADFFRLESVRGLVRCEEKLKLRRKLRLTAPWPPDPLLKFSQLLFSTGSTFHQQSPRKCLKNSPVTLPVEPTFRD